VTLGLMMFFAIIELSLSAWLTSQLNRFHNERTLSEVDRVRFTLFASTWTIVWATFLLILFGNSATGSMFTSAFGHLIMLGFTWLMWTAAAGAVTDTLSGGLNCKLQTAFVYCNHLNALEAFAWIEWCILHPLST
ncbi:hypothetical protein C8R46DRAFT_909668, partial [Mycena filopes]